MKMTFRVVRDSVPSMKKSALFTEIVRVDVVPYRFVRMAPGMLGWNSQQPHQDSGQGQGNKGP